MGSNPIISTKNKRLNNLIRRSKNRRRPPEPKLPPIKFNEQIRALEVRVVGAQGENLGVMKTEEAIKEARNQGFDLVEVSGQATPPITKIASHDKYRYQQEKLAKKQKQEQAKKTSELKHIRITPRAGSNDLEVKLKKVRSFIEDGDKVEILLFLKGREKANKDFARGKLDDFLNKVGMPYRVISPIKYAGRGFVVQIVK